MSTGLQVETAERIRMEKNTSVALGNKKKL